MLLFILYKLHNNLSCSPDSGLVEWVGILHWNQALNQMVEREHKQVSPCSSCWDYTHFRLNGTTSPTPPSEGGAPFGIPGSTHPTQSCSLSWLHSTRPLVWGGINATLLNVSWSGTAETKREECCVMAGAGAARAPQENNKATSGRVLQECAPWKEKGGGREDGHTWMGSSKTPLNTWHFPVLFPKIRR